MTIMNETVRLFFALSALILVGMLSTPSGDLTQPLDPSPRVVASVTASKKINAKKMAKLTKSPRKIARRG